MRYMTCAAAIMLMAFATTGCQTIGTTSCSGCADSGMMTGPGCDSGCAGCASGNCSLNGGCASGGCNGSGFSGDGRGTLFGALFAKGAGAKGCGNPNCNGSCNGGANRYGAGNGGMYGAGNGAGTGFSQRDLAGCHQCMGRGFPCVACLAPGGRLCHLSGAGQGLLGGAQGAAASALNRFLARDCQTPHTIPYAQGGMGGPGMGGPTPHYSYPYYTTRAPRDFLMANPPSIGP